MLDDRRQRYRKRRGNLAHRQCLRPRQALQDRSPCRIGERPKGAIECTVPIVNHMVEYRRTTCRVNREAAPHTQLKSVAALASPAVRRNACGQDGAAVLFPAWQGPGKVLARCCCARPSQGWLPRSLAPPLSCFACVLSRLASLLLRLSLASPVSSRTMACRRGPKARFKFKVSRAPGTGLTKPRPGAGSVRVLG